MRRVLVIGGNLFIGRELVRRLLARGDDVTILHRGRHNPYAGQTKEIRCDRNDIPSTTRALRQGNYDYVFDHVYDWQRGTTGQQVRAAALACGPALRRYVFVSSCAVYGEGLERTEESPLAGPEHPDAYCRNKADAERALLALHKNPGVSTATLRPPFIYGRHNPFRRESFFWERILAGRPVLVPEGGSRLMQFVSVSDLVEAALLAADTDAAAGRAYNVAHAETLRQDEVVYALGAAAGIEPNLRYAPRAMLQGLGGGVFEPPYYFGQYFDMPPITLEVSRARQELGFRAKALSDGLRETWNWYRTLDRTQLPELDFSFDDAVLAALRT